MTNIFENGKFTQTTTYFDGWQLPEKERKVIVDLVESDNGAFCFTECIYDQGGKLFVDTAIDYIDDYGDDEDFDYTEARAVLQNAFDAGVDIITFYK